MNTSARRVSFFEGYRRIASRSDGLRHDWINPACLLALAVMGLFFIYSAQKFTDNNLWTKQVFWIVIGAAAYVTVAKLDYQIWLRHGHWVYVLGILCLLLLWTPLGDVREGARRWIDLKVASVQPSEAAKLATLVMVSSILARSELGSFGESIYVLGKVFLVVALPIVLIFAQPDLGSALVFPPMIFALLYISKLSDRFFVTVFALFLALLAVLSVDLYRYFNYYQGNDLDFFQDRGAYESSALLPLKDYQRIRIMTLVAPEAIDPRGIGDSWNYRQSLQAVGTGGFTGKGWTQGDQAQLGYLPRSVAHNDFIFAVLAEESGFLGGVTVIALYLILLTNTLRIAGKARDRFGLLLATGVSVVFLIHSFVNIGMTIGLMPITGLPLPFVSYGGSFMLSCCLFQGIVQSVYRHRRALIA